MMAVQLWVRHETRSTERRTPIVPDDARLLIEHGISITVERSPQRVFDTEAYAEVGCSIAEPGSWVDAPPQAHIVGLKELPDDPDRLIHSHIFFGHAYKGQVGASELLERFRLGGGQLLDIEYLTDEHGRRVVAFGYWAGYVGAALGLLQLAGRLKTPLQPTSKVDIDSQLVALELTVQALVTGGAGRSGRGARDALARVTTEITSWERSDTLVLDKGGLLGHEFLVNCVASMKPREAFVTSEDVAAQRNLRLIADVTADVTSANNLLPINTAITTWSDPVRQIATDPPLEVIAIDNLPSLLPLEASVDFSGQLRPQLEALGGDTVPWSNTRDQFRKFLPR